MAGYALWVEIVIRQLQLVIVTKAAKDGPGGFVPASLDEEGVEEEEACRRDQPTQTQWSQLSTHPQGSTPQDHAFPGNTGCLDREL